VSRPLSKRRTLLEHQGLWLLFAVVSALVSCALALAVDGGFLTDYAYFPAILRGYTLTGLFFGGACVALALLTFLYSLRKRSLQEKMPVGTMAGWLWGHVYLGLLCVLCAIIHAGYGSVGFELSLGKALLALLLVLVVSGLVWRVIYASVPAKAANEVGNYSQAASAARAAASAVEIEKLGAGRSPALRQMVDWLMSVTASDPEIAHYSRNVPPPEQALIPELVRLTRGLHQARAREKRQGSYRRVLQGMRVLHVPISLLFLVLLPLHVVWALDLPAKALPPGAVLGSTLGGFHPSENCRSCHERVVDEWRTSMHAHGLSSPVMIAQNNLALRETLVSTTSPDPKNVCVNCHGPLAIALAKNPTLPFVAEGALAEPALFAEGISCTVCHQWNGESKTAGGGLTAFQEGLVPGRTFFGRYEDAVGNAYHQSEATPLFRDPSQLCRNCHSVHYDRNGDGRIDRGTDLVLQTLYDEWEDYAKVGGASCIDCHMPVVKGSRAAETALLPLEQDAEAPARTLRSHRFIGVDYPIDSAAKRDASHAEREALLRSASTLTVDQSKLKVSDTGVAFEVALQNTGVGHNFPGGFAFVRQMWFEITVLDAQNRALATSGHLLQPTDDLCDSSIIDSADNPMKEFLVGCTTADRQLVSFQQMLLDQVELLRDGAGTVQLDARNQPKLRPAPGSKEVVVQYLTSGAVPRVRPSTGKPTPTLLTGEQKSFPYFFELPSGSQPARLVVRLLFRPMPPYFMRALSKTQQAGDGQKLSAFLGNLEIIEMSRVETQIPAR
jgi:hypothetical protein